MSRHPNGYWIKERCIESAKKFNCQVDWIAYESSAYYSAYFHGWLDECTAHMQRKKPNGFYTKEICLADAHKYKFPKDWMKYSPSAIHAAYMNGWYDECTAHMTHKLKWTKEICIKIASRYNSKTEWSKNHINSYNAAVRNGWIPVCCTHMKIKERKPNGYWTKERCLENASKYRSVFLWVRENNGASATARREGWYKLCSDLIRNNRYNNKSY